MTKPVDDANADEKMQALIAADRLINRLRNDVAEGLKPDGLPHPETVYRLDPEPPEMNGQRPFGHIVEERKIASEVDQVRAAPDEPPKTPIGARLSGRDA